jgi:hypothetical protein
MFNTKGNQWVIPELGLLDIPDHLVRMRDAWAIETDVDTWWVWRDVDHGWNYMESLREAAVFAITIGSLETEEARMCNDLYRKDRLTATGVIGVFFRSGLKQAYHVILDGVVTIFPYNEGKGFCKAVAASEKLMSATTKNFIKRVGADARLHLP